MPASEDFTPLDTLKRYLVQDQYRPLGNDPWTGLMKGQQDLPLGGTKPRDETVLYRTASPLVNITEGDIGRATDVGLAASGGGLKGQQIRAYHSSPHDFDKFDLSKIGTGEGAQVYGHGLYFAENPAVSGQGGQYWNQFLSRFGGAEREAAERLQGVKFNRNQAIDQAQNDLREAQRGASMGGGPVGDYWQTRVAQQQAELERLTSGKPVGPRTYEVNINADPAHMLDWDKPLSGQARTLQEFADRRRITPDQSGEQLYRSMGANRERASKALLDEAGIPGIKYLDQGSRGAGTGSSNYVIFNPSILDIVKKYGLAGLASAPALTSGLRDRENQP